jgi:hypothetical protein
MEPSLDDVLEKAAQLQELVPGTLRDWSAVKAVPEDLAQRIVL